MTTPAPSTRLDDQLCFSLYAASRAVVARYRPMLDSMGITYTQLLVLMALWDPEDPGPLTVRGIADRLGLDTATVSPLLKRMEALQLITRRRDTADERRVYVELTEAGRALERPTCDMSAMMIDVLQMSAEEVAALKEQLDTITERTR
ncbi:MarR family winged helix-turn-helix transcriptional regulator [Trujillonella humicola]|uniref:MarR family winged helix-turn-helix transcriptional regulator n=1 Tax=Trujillonella humicola TaxID=3383699 RepID=UPI003905DC27